MSRRIKKKKEKVETPSATKSEDVKYSKNMYDHLKPENIAKQKEAAAIKNGNSLTRVVAIFLIGVVVIALALNGAFTGELGGSNNPNNNNNQNPINTGTNQVALTSLCLEDHSDYDSHYHFFLSITVFGSIHNIPAGIGDGTVQSSSVDPNDSCMRGMHTHTGDPPGRVHVELPASYNGIVTLGDFIAIWGAVVGLNYQLSATELLDVTGSVTLESDDSVVTIDDPGDYQIVNKGSAEEFIALTITP